MKTIYKGIELDNFAAKALSEDQVKGLSIYQEQSGVVFADWEPIADQYDYDYSFTRFVLTDDEANELLKLINGNDDDKWEARQQVIHAGRINNYHFNHNFFYSIN